MDPALLLAAGIVVVAMGVAWQVPSQAHWALLVVGFSMDPIRKVIPGEPVWLTAVVAGVLAVVYLRQQQPDLARRRPALLAGAPELVGPLQLFGLWVAFQAVRGYEATGSPIIAAIGLLSYFAPALAVAAGYALASSVQGLRRVLGAYLACVLVLAVTVLLSFSGVKLKIFEQVGKGVVIYDWDIGVIQLHCGLIRGPEMAGWHLGTGLCILVLLAATARSKAWSIMTVPAVAVLGTAMFVTGRRKYILAALVFALAWAVLSWAYRRRRVLAMLATVGIGLAGLGVVALDGLLSQPGGSILLSHANRVGMGSDQAQGRFVGMTLDAIPAALETNGFLGAGAGVGSQGAQHFAAAGIGTGWAGEGGLGKIVGELGLPGFLMALWVLALVGTRALRTARVLARDARPGGDEACALTSILLSCGMTFTIGHQVYGDPFVLIMVGSLVGMVLRLPSLDYVPASAARRHAPAPAADSTPWGAGRWQS